MVINAIYITIKQKLLMNVIARLRKIALCGTIVLIISSMILAGKNYIPQGNSPYLVFVIPGIYMLFKLVSFLPFGKILPIRILKVLALIFSLLFAIACVIVNLSDHLYENDLNVIKRIILLISIASPVVYFILNLISSVIIGKKRGRLFLKEMPVCLRKDIMSPITNLRKFLVKVFHYRQKKYFALGLGTTKLGCALLLFWTVIVLYLTIAGICVLCDIPIPLIQTIL